MLMLANAGWLGYGRLGLQANAGCLHGHCGNAALTRLVYCMTVGRKVMACASCVVIMFLNPLAVALAAC